MSSGFAEPCGGQKRGARHRAAITKIDDTVGANYRAVCRARSRAEFVAKMGVVLEEVDETAFWLTEPAPLLKEANDLVAVIAASLRTAKSSLNQ